MAFNKSVFDIDPDVRKAGLALSLWIEDNLRIYIAPELLENDSPAVRLCGIETETPPGWEELFPARKPPSGSCGLSVRFRALKDNESPDPAKQGFVINGIRFVAEIFSSFEERFFVMRVVDSKYNLIAELVGDKDYEEGDFVPSNVLRSIIQKGGSLLNLASIPSFHTMDAV